MEATHASQRTMVHMAECDQDLEPHTFEACSATRLLADLQRQIIERHAAWKAARS